MEGAEPCFTLSKKELFQSTYKLTLKDNKKPFPFKTFRLNSGHPA
jgi:hypothetical protein